MGSSQCRGEARYHRRGNPYAAQSVHHSCERGPRSSCGCGPEATTSSMRRIQRPGLRIAKRCRGEPRHSDGADVIAKFDSQPPAFGAFCSVECGCNFLIPPLSPVASAFGFLLFFRAYNNREHPTKNERLCSSFLQTSTYLYLCFVLFFS